VRGDRVGSLGDRDIAAQFGAEGGDAGVGDPARDEPVVPVEVDVRVEREAVHGHAAGHADTDGRDLAFGLSRAGCQQHDGPSGHASGLHAEIGNAADDRLFDPADVVNDEHV
jgi:hypothetical protein